MNNTNINYLYILCILYVIYILIFYLKNILKLNIKNIILISLIILYILYKLQLPGEDIIILLVITIIYLYNNKDKINHFTNIFNYNKDKINHFTNIFNYNKDKINYFTNTFNYKYNKIRIEEDTQKLLTLTKQNSELKQKIENKYTEAQLLINNNCDIKKFLIFNNLIDINGEPIYKVNNMSNDVILYNKIKIILILTKILSL